MNGVGINGLPGTPPLDASMGLSELDEALLTELAPEVDPLDELDDGKLLQIMQMAYERSKSARETRKAKNAQNWNAFHGKFSFLDKKKPGQSTIVIPSLETSLEQIGAQLANQLVGHANWFSAKYEGDAPPMPGLDATQAARILRQELDRLAVDSGCMPTTYGIGALIDDSIKIGCIESEVTWKVMMLPEEQPTYDLTPDRQLQPGVTTAMRLHIDLVPFDDHFPDPSPAKHYNIHEVIVPIADLPEMGFSPEEIDNMRHASPGSEKIEEQRKRGGIANALPIPLHHVLLREYWGDLIDPQTGDLIERQCFFVTAANTHVVRKPVRIRDIYWGGVRPIISIPLLPTPKSSVHHAFLDIGVPLIEAECELFNLMCDAGFHAALGAKEVHSYKFKDPMTVAAGIQAGGQYERAEGYGDQPAIVRIETGTLTNDMLTIYDRIARTRGEAFRTNDTQLGRFAPRKSSATEISQIDEASDDLFSKMSTRMENTGIEPLIELCWLFLWQFADEPMVQRIGQIIGPENAQALAILTPEERYVAFASHVSFKVQGYKYQLAKTKDVQKAMMLMQVMASNPALAQALQPKIDMTKFAEMIIQGLGIDPTDLAPDGSTQPLDPMLLANQSGGQTNPAEQPGMAGQQEQAMPPNAMGNRGVQLP